MLLDRLKEIVGPAGWTDDPAELEPHLTEWRGRYRGATPLMVSPASTQEVSEVVRACADTATPVVPQGGNTGLCGGAIPRAEQGEILLSLRRMNRIRDVSPLDFSLVAEAGCLLVEVQAAATNAGLFFPLSLAAEGSARIGGNVSTNAGGINVLRYGNTREQVLGLEVVLPDGRVWDGLRTLRKDTAGYDLKQLFIGAEGTLGVITAVSLRLHPPVRDPRSVFSGMAEVGDAIRLLYFLREELGESLQAFELIQERALDFVLRHVPGTRRPLDRPFPWYALIETSGVDGERLEEVLSGALEASLIDDAVIAKSDAESQALWRLRHSISEAQKHEGASLKHDVSVPVGRIGDLIEQTEAALAAYLPEARPVAFGHVGDGNVHFNVSQPEGWTAERFFAEREKIAAIVYDATVTLGGSISAEHGIGVAKREYLARYRSATELELMRAVKSALDPANIMNPGKVV